MLFRSVDLGFYADDVLLCLAPPAGLSARNALPCEVRALDFLGHEVLAELRVGEVRVRARLTPAANPFDSNLSMLREPPRPYSKCDRAGVSRFIGTRGRIPRRFTPGSWLRGEPSSYSFI